MSNAIEFNSVWKKFKKGEKLNSLRDSIPAFFNRAIRERGEKTLKDQEFWAVKDVSFDIPHGGVIGMEERTVGGHVNQRLINQLRGGRSGFDQSPLG